MDATAPSSACANCGASLAGRFCVACGQEARTLHQPLRAVVAEWAGDAFGFDSRVVRTLRRLLRTPGGLTLDIWEGRRARHVPPLRLYLLVSFLFFVTLAWLDVPLSQMSIDGKEIRGSAPIKVSLTPEELAEIESRGLGGRLLAAAARDPQAFEQRLLDHFPLTLFLLVPALASFLQVLMRSARRYWLEHVVFALHLQTFGFLVLTAAALLDALLGTDAFGALAVGAALVYLTLALRRAYGVRLRWAIPATAVLTVAYACTAGVLMLALATLTAAAALS